MFEIKVVEKVKIHIFCSVVFFPKTVILSDNVEKYSAAREVADGNMAARCMLT